MIMKLLLIFRRRRSAIAGRLHRLPNVWRGLVGRVEYRHDEASRKAFSLQDHGTMPTSHAQDTISFELYYLFF
jgi:hypothetical protein